MRVYVTHCSAKKDDSSKDSGKQVTPDSLYTATPIQRFMNQCKAKKARWAIFSDLYGIWFPDEKRCWYEKDPNTVTEQAFRKLVDDFDQKLQPYDAIWFYYNPGRFHPLYVKLLKQTTLRYKVTQFTHLHQIT